jgi:hypothetical protein
MSQNNIEFIKRNNTNIFETMRVAMPARIESYDATKSLVDVKIAIPQVRQDESVFEIPVITSVPVMWLSTLTTSVTFPLKRGDYGLVVFCDWDIAKWAVGLDESEPQSERRHNLTDSVFFPQTHGLRPSSLVGLSLKHGTSEVLLTETGIVVTGGAVTVNTPALTVNASSTTFNGNVTITGGANIGGIPFNTHKHGGVTTGGGITGNAQ